MDGIAVEVVGALVLVGVWMLGLGLGLFAGEGVLRFVIVSEAGILRREKGTGCVVLREANGCSLGQ